MKKLIIKLFANHSSKKEFNIHHINSILLKPIGNAIGDSIIHINHLVQIKNSFPNIKIGVLVTDRNRAIFNFSKVADILIEDTFLEYLKQRNKWDLYFDFLPTFTSKSIILDSFINAKYIINFGKKNKKHYNLNSVKNYDLSISIPEYTHFKDYLMFSPLSPYLKPINEYSLNTQNNIRYFWNNRNRIKILLNPQGSTRFLPTAELSYLIKNVSTKNTEFLLVNTTDSENYFNELPKLKNLFLAPKTSLIEYFGLINSSDIVIAVDSGAVHIACAYKKTLLAFYANQKHNLYKWLPISNSEDRILTIVGEKETEDNNNTNEFKLDEAIKWLNKKISELENDKAVLS